MKNKIKEMIENGFASKRITKILNINNNKINEIVNSEFLCIKKEQFSNDKIDYICDLYKQGVSAKNLGIKYSIDKRRVQKWAQFKGILRSKEEACRFTFFNENYFDDINTNSKAYWLGFFYADAYNCCSTNTVSIALQDSIKNSDYNHLVKLSHAFDLDLNNIKRYNSFLNGKKYPTCSVRFYSKYLCNKLTSIGCPQAKSFIIKYPTWLLSEFNRHFIRGLFDGDGCLTFRSKQKEWKLSLVSTKECCEQIQQILIDELGIIVKFRCISQAGKNTYELETSGNEKINNILSWLYYKSSIDNRLDRKYNKFQELLVQQKGRNIKRENYLLDDEMKHKISNSTQKSSDLAQQYNIHPKTVLEIKKRTNDYSRIVEINGQPLTAKFFKPLSKEKREAFVQPLFDHFRNQGWFYPNIPEDVLKKEYNKLCNFEPDLSTDELFNNSSLATKICKHFCHSFYLSTERGKRNMVELWEDDDVLLKLVRNRLVLNWHSKVNETFNISHRMMIQGMRSMRLVPSITMFKPTIAKYICMKYSKPGDIVGDYSCGFGGRLLGAISCGRKYIGTDPLTADELENMCVFFGFKDYKIINSGSEAYYGEENSIDLYWSSPPYYDQEYYSGDINQAYNKGEDYFYNEYWNNTLKNVKRMLKPGKWFGLNVKNYPKMLSMAKDYFGDPSEEVRLRTIRSHLNKQVGVTKYESIFMFINNK